MCHIYQQDHRCVVRFPVSPIIAYLYMKCFEVEAMTSASHKQRVWIWYIDDTLIIYDKKCEQQFTDHISSLNPHIKFTNDPKNVGTLTSKS